MQHLAARASIAFVLLATAACSQDPAQVELKGQNTYTRSLDSGYAYHTPAATAPNNSYSNSYSPASTYTPPNGVYTNHPVSQDTSSTAGIQSIGVSDLPPPSKTGSGQHSENTPVTNQWTGKPHQQVASSDVKPAAKPVTVAQNATQGSTHSHGYIWPVNGTKVISGFGPKGAGKANDGINIAAADGEPVWAAADGEVVYVGDGVNGYGNMVLIKHTGDKTTTYAHLSRATVDKYDRVKQGDIIGYVGTTGNVKDPQLLFAMRDGNTPVDPKKYLTTKMASN